MLMIKYLRIVRRLLDPKYQSHIRAVLHAAALLGLKAEDRFERAAWQQGQGAGPEKAVSYISGPVPIGSPGAAPYFSTRVSCLHLSFSP
jgi:hypothetical protein